MPDALMGYSFPLTPYVTEPFRLFIFGVAAVAPSLLLLPALVVTPPQPFPYELGVDMEAPYACLLGRPWVQEATLPSEQKVNQAERKEGVITSATPNSKAGTLSPEHPFQAFEISHAEEPKEDVVVQEGEAASQKIAGLAINAVTGKAIRPCSWIYPMAAGEELSSWEAFGCAAASAEGSM
ncbi:hypothetical protein COLO4_37617 [Corchorus olitorius]|uniref:Uncharacterized protein n=1 Tax=Corchorus olitorius TaxID=93759 RepID=A0A1R3G0P1_9ROSI|nr:hypothetical protein COLO4_37617 [Corchorus olitorius]